MNRPESHTVEAVRSLMRAPLEDRLAYFAEHQRVERARHTQRYLRVISRANGPNVHVLDGRTGEAREMLNFAAPAYLGVQSHPHVAAEVKAALESFGAGLGGSPMLDGHTTLTERLESRVAKLVGAEAAMVYSSGFAANIGSIRGLVGPQDVVLTDERVHASVKVSLDRPGIRWLRFQHNMVDDLKRWLDVAFGMKRRDVYVFVESVYSMDGDLGKIDEIAALKDRFPFRLVVDDAHGFGVLGPRGFGAGEHFGDEGIDITIGSFGKATAVCGGFLAGDSQLVDYLRVFSSSYLYSSAPSPLTIAAVSAGLDVLVQEPWRVEKLKSNVALAVQMFADAGIAVKTGSAILPVIAPPQSAIAEMADVIAGHGVFVNAVQYPAVPRHLERFRVVVGALHTTDDLRRLVAAFQEAMT